MPTKKKEIKSKKPVSKNKDVKINNKEVKKKKPMILGSIEENDIEGHGATETLDPEMLEEGLLDVDINPFGDRYEE